MIKKKFDPSPKCGGELFYTDIDNIKHFGPMLGVIRIPVSVPIVKMDFPIGKMDSGEYKSPQIYIETIYPYEKFLSDDSILTDLKKSMKFPDFRMPMFQTEEIIMKEVTRDGFSLEYVPKDLITPELCLAAVSQNGDALRFVPKELKTPELCLAAVSQNGRALYFVSTKLRTPEICLAAVTQDGCALTDVPEELKKLF